MKTPELPFENPSALNKRQFTGTRNPRHLRALTVLLRGPVPRERVDTIAGCANGPALISELRSLGLGPEHLVCERVSLIDRDGKLVRPGVYSLTAEGRRMVISWLARRPGGDLHG